METNNKFNNAINEIRAHIADKFNASITLAVIPPSIQ